MYKKNKNLPWIIFISVVVLVILILNIIIFTNSIDSEEEEFIPSVNSEESAPEPNEEYLMFFDGARCARGGPGGIPTVPRLDVGVKIYKNGEQISFSDLEKDNFAAYIHGYRKEIFILGSPSMSNSVGITYSDCEGDGAFGGLSVRIDLIIDGSVVSTNTEKISATRV
jgi:hypothetical protein